MTIKSLYPSIRPSLNLDFANSKKLDSRITFTRASTGTYVDAAGVIQTAASGVARFDHNPTTGESLGLLIEEARTNDEPNSNSFNWAPTNPKISSSTTVDPFLGTNAKRLTPTTANEVHGWQRYTGYGTGNYAFSMFVKPAGYSKISIGTNNSNPNDFTVDLNGSGSYTAGNATTFPTRLVKLADGWFRLTWQWNNTGGGGANNFHPYCIVLNDSGQSTFTGNGTSGVDFYGFQVETGGSFSTSYIPTSGATVTRAADVATLSNTGSSIFSTSAFTVVSTPFGTAVGGSTVKLVGPTIKRTAIYNGDLTQTQINALAGVNDNFWRWRVTGASFALPSATTDGSVTVDWGDGTIETLTSAAHTFTDSNAYHTIGFRLNSGTYFRPAINGGTNAIQVIAVGPAPASMKVDAYGMFYTCYALRAFDATLNIATGTSLFGGFNNCTLSAFPVINTATVTSFIYAWESSNLTSFPLLNCSAVTTFQQAWNGCPYLTTFPANMFNTTGTLVSTAFTNAFTGCALTAASIENILTSLVTNGRSNITLNLTGGTNAGASTWTANAVTAYNTLISRGWTITRNA